MPAAMAGAARLATARASGPVRFALWAFGALFTFVLSVAAWDFVTGLFARNGVIGWIALVLLGLALLAAVILAVLEWAAFARLARIDQVRTSAVEAMADGDLGAAKAVVAKVEAIYARRPDSAWGMARLSERKAEVFDADALLTLAETELMTPLDQAARREIEAALRQVATVTAFVPLALADVAMALYANLRMIRRVAEIYGGRSGSFGSLRLMRRVFGHLLATGVVALTDDMIGSVAGGGVLSKISRRFGEGMVNAALTARVGVAAMEVCRPLPFAALPRPKVTNLVSRGLAGLVSRAETEAGADAPKGGGGQA
jgi:putative membrane protein